MSSTADWVSYHYYVGLLKISEDKVRSRFSEGTMHGTFIMEEQSSCVFFVKKRRLVWARLRALVGFALE